MMILKLAYRNIWRNKRRTLVILVSIVIGVVVLMLVDTLSLGMVRQILDNQVNLHITHIQIHRKGFSDDPAIKNYLPDQEKVEATLGEFNEIRVFGKRVISYGLINSAYNSSGVIIVGIQPEKEKFLTVISRSIVEGNYLQGKGEIVIGRRLAQKLNVELGSKIILMVSDLNGNIASDVFRVAGFYESPSAEFDRAYVYIVIEDAQRLLALGNKVVEYAMILEDQSKIEPVRKKIKDMLGDLYEVLTYADVVPVLTMLIDMYKEMIWIYYLIIGIGVVFGIINLMLMSVFERIREFGVLKAIGLKDGKIFVLIVLESLMIGIIGTVVGLVIGIIVYIPLSRTGVDLSIFSESLVWFGSGRIIYPVLTLYTFILVAFTMPLVSVVGAIYPALKSVKFEPVEALKHI